MFLSAQLELFLFFLPLFISQRPVWAAGTGAPVQPPHHSGTWSGWGGSAYNNRWASENTDINSTTVGNLVQNCKLDYPVGVSATPVILNDTVYYPTSNGSFYALNYGTCEYLWEVNVTKIIYDFKPLNKLQEINCLPISRTSPQIDGDVLYFGTQAHALLVAIDLNTGDLLGTTQVSDHPLAILTMSPTVYDGKLFIGASSQEESATLDPDYPCCDFVGLFSAYTTFNHKTKKFSKLWDIETLPKGKGWAGATVWGSQPPIDPVRNQVFIGTGNTYVYPPEYVKCLNQSTNCLPDDVWQETILALDIASGKVNWKKTMASLDGWVMSCGYAGAPESASPLCPVAPGPDADFGMAPTFVPASLGAGTTGVDSLVIGQKDGHLYSFNAATGDITWTTMTSADINVGTLSWGLAVDDTQIYFTGINFGSKDWPLIPSGQVINNSAFGAASLQTGQILWEVPCPGNSTAYTPPGVVNDLVFVGQGGGSAEKVPGAVHALEKHSGAIVKTLPVDSVQHGGVAVHEGFIFFGSGYHYMSAYEEGSFYVYGLPDAIAAAKKRAKDKPKSKPKAKPTASDDKEEDSASEVTGGESGGSFLAPASASASRKSSLASRTGADFCAAALYHAALLAILMAWLG